MKTTSTLFFVLLLATLSSFSQRPILIYDGSMEMSSNFYPGIYVSIPEVPFETMQKNWIKAIQFGTKSKAVYDNGNWSIFGANINSISPTPINIYSRLENQDSLVRMLVSMELKKDDFVQKGSHETELASAREFLRQFAKDQYMNVANEQLKAEEKKLKAIEKEFSSFKKQQASLEKKIRAAEKTIKAEQDALILQNSELNNVSVELASQTIQYNELADGPAKEERTKYLKSLEKRKAKIAKGIKSAESKIEKANKTIQGASSNIPGKENLKDEAKDKIAIQQGIVQQVKDKIKKIEQY